MGTRGVAAWEKSIKERLFNLLRLNESNYRRTLDIIRDDFTGLFLQEEVNDEVSSAWLSNNDALAYLGDFGFVSGRPKIETPDQTVWAGHERLLMWYADNRDDLEEIKESLPDIPDHLERFLATTQYLYQTQPVDPQAFDYRHSGEVDNRALPILDAIVGFAKVGEPSVDIEAFGPRSTLPVHDSDRNYFYEIVGTVSGAAIGYDLSDGRSTVDDVERAIEQTIMTEFVWAHYQIVKEEWDPPKPYEESNSRADAHPEGDGQSDDENKSKPDHPEDLAKDALWEIWVHTEQVAEHFAEYEDALGIDDLTAGGFGSSPPDALDLDEYSYSTPPEFLYIDVDAGRDTIEFEAYLQISTDTIEDAIE